MSDALVSYEVSDGVAVLSLTDPPANAYSYDMMRRLDALVLEARMDESVHAIVLRGAGEKFTLNRLEQTPKLVIAALNGHCVGGGLEVAMAADLRLARKGAGKMGLPEVGLGVLPGTGGTQRLTRLVGKARAIELMATGRLFEFEEGRELGLVNDVIEAADADAFLARVKERAREFVPPGRASKAVGLIKRAVQTGAEMSFQDAVALERELQQQLFESEDAREGLAAHLEKRKPAFKGR
ncbi:MAG: enoyl-CoA hydratase [Acidobacteria bacterium]|nr:MAG: enoyl-CoA hydratase [Acidobacteriota bacterium]